MQQRVESGCRMCFFGRPKPKNKVKRTSTAPRSQKATHQKFQYRNDIQNNTSNQEKKTQKNHMYEHIKAYRINTCPCHHYTKAQTKRQHQTSRQNGKIKPAKNTRQKKQQQNDTKYRPKKSKQTQMQQKKNGPLTYHTYLSKSQAQVTT